MKLFLLRHASPDWDRTDIPYDIPPGPSLSSKGEREAKELATFLKSQGVVKLYYSPFERTAQTAKIASAQNRIPCVEDQRLVEWREVDELQVQVGERMLSVFNNAIRESAEIGPIGLVSHGGPVTLLLQELKIDKNELTSYRKMFDHFNPLPPAGAWKVEPALTKNSWNLQLEFTPKVSEI